MISFLITFLTIVFNNKSLEEQLMLNKLSVALVAATLIFTATAVNAHSPEMHKKENAEKPNCEAIQNMDHSKMDVNDPIMQAMMTQCMGGDNHGGKHKTMEQDHGDMHRSDE
ncbi:MAG: hypothetical protein ACJAUP_000360 [Cellvibrionaceae bacterium]